MRRPVLLLVAAHLGVAVVLGALGDWTLWPTDGAFRIAGFALCFAVVGLLPMHVELGRHGFQMTLTEAVLVAALFSMAPVGVVLAAAAGEVVNGLIRRQQALKVVFNAAAGLSTTTLAAAAFALVSNPDPRDPLVWTAVLLAVAAAGVANHVSTSAVLTLLGEQRFRAVILASLAPAVAATGVSASLGIAGVVLLTVHPAAPALVAPLAVAVVVATRRLAVQRSEHLRFQRLYAASARSSGLQGFDAVLVTLADEARRLGTGAAGMCCGPDRTGTWRGVVVDDDGSRPANDDAVAAVRLLVTQGGAQEMSASDAPASLRDVAPAQSLVFAGTPAGDSTAVVAVWRDIERDEEGRRRSEVLGAFAGHVALVIANARLYEEVEEALRHQLDVSRQKDEFVAVVSHELRTPLTSILGAAATLRRRAGALNEEQHAQLVDIAERQARRLQRLIEDLLLVAAARDEQAPVACEDVDVRVLLGELDAELRPIAGARLSVRFSSEVGVVKSDGLKVRQILGNLVDNAAKYAPGSTIELRGEVVGDEVRLSVTDHGPGIAESDRERAFERFVQLDQSSTRARGGTGLGLYLCRQLAHRIGGTLELDETPGGGARFTLTLPCPRPAPTLSLADADGPVDAGRQPLEVAGLP